MWKKVFPSSFDNSFGGHAAALWLFYLITIITIGRSLAHLFLPDGGAQSIATIPLDEYTSGAATTVISIFAFWGLSQILIAVMMSVVALRYRSMIPLMYLIVLAEYLGRISVGLLKPLETVSTPPGSTGTPFLILAVLIGLTLTLKTKAATER